MGTLKHMFWDCRKLQKYWEEVFATLTNVLGTPLVASPELAILGACDDSQFNRDQLVIVRQSLFHAHKCLTQQWKSVAPPTHQMWMVQMLNFINCMSYLYTKRGSSTKFDKVWGSWPAS
ncbi:hypothetical protein XELAEV_18008143mg [Xenopus laevis]|uniref:Uncharacterized protein n=1 Tax=Xenopus laevis TaxID=8355 RepID=A0A974I5T7_XENLA|nr:hypothetical protein XELAEV_18008143mg [Xenopus laevis]